MQIGNTVYYLEGDSKGKPNRIVEGAIVAISDDHCYLLSGKPDVWFSEEVLFTARQEATAFLLDWWRNEVRAAQVQVKRFEESLSDAQNRLDAAMKTVAELEARA